MVYVSKENDEAINRVAALTCLTRKQVVQAMSNHRKRLKAEGFTDEDLNLIKTTGGLSKKLDDMQELLQTCLDQRHCPPQVRMKLDQVATMMVSKAPISYVRLLTTSRDKSLLWVAIEEGVEFTLA
jgi:uncharacterized protein with von Willebrand factor type A (vWA) domain